MSDWRPELITMLGTKVSPVSLDHVADFRGIRSRSGKRHLAQELDRLVENDCLSKYCVMVKAVPSLKEPLAHFEPTDPLRDHADVAWKTNKRWATAHNVMKTIYTLGGRTARVFGDTKLDIGNVAAIAHDLALASLYLQFLLRGQPQWAADWAPDWANAKAAEVGVKVPDVSLCGTDRKPYRLLEMCGRYSNARVVALHMHAIACGLPLTLY